MAHIGTSLNYEAGVQLGHLFLQINQFGKVFFRDT